MYLILRDSMGDGLHQTKTAGLNILSTDELVEVLITETDILLQEEGYENLADYECDTLTNIANNFAIFQLCEKIDTTNINSWARTKIIEAKHKEAKEEYDLYLRLKKKYERT